MRLDPTAQPSLAYQLNSNQETLNPTVLTSPHMKNKTNNT